MTDYYLGVGYDTSYSVGKLKQKPVLPLTDVDVISGLEINFSDDPMDYDAVRDEQVAMLEDGDSLTIVYPNKAAQYILDEWAEDYNIPNNQREELWTKDGVEETFIFFINAEEENWYWLVNAEVDYYDDDGRPRPAWPADEEDDG